MDQLDEWFRQYTETPVGSLLLFLLIFLSRVAVREWSRRRKAKKKPKRKGTAHG